MGKKYAPSVTKPIMEIDNPFSGIRFEVWGGIA